MTSYSQPGPGRFNDVVSSAELQFPTKFPEIREVAAATRGTQNTILEARTLAESAEGKASTARNLALFGIIAGILGIALGAGSIVVVLQRRKA